MNKLVSIVVPSYCHEDYILQSLASVHAQTYSPIEVIIVDDCSPDHTFDRAASLMATGFARRFESVTLIRNERNLGAHQTINRGVRQARGHWVSIINSDDLYAPARLAKLIETMEREGSELGFSAVRLVGEDWALENADQPEPAGQVANPDPLVSSELDLLALRQVLDSQAWPTLGFALLKRNLAISTGNLLFSRRLFDRIGGFSSLKYCHDWQFVLRAMVHTEPTFLHDELYFYRVHDGNSFRAYSNLVHIEPQICYRDFFRRVVESVPDNPLCPSPAFWPGYFETFIRAARLQHLYDPIAGQPVKASRTLPPKPWHARFDFSTASSVFERFLDRIDNNTVPTSDTTEDAQVAKQPSARKSKRR